MTVTVSIWNRGEDGVGHAAVDVNGRYCSFWPGGDGYSDKNAVQKQSVRSANHSYNEDLGAEGRYPDVQVQLEGLNERAMLQKWDELKGERYSFAKTNCSTVAAEMLKAGSGMRPDFRVAAWPSEYMPQGLLYRVAGGAIDSYVYATGQQTVWTPEQVTQFARGIDHAQQLAQQEALAREQARLQAEAQAREVARLQAEAFARQQAEAFARQQAEELARQQRAIEHNPWADHQQQPRRRRSGDSSSGSERSYHTARSHTSTDSGTQKKSNSYRRSG